MIWLSASIGQNCWRKTWRVTLMLKDFKVPCILTWWQSWYLKQQHKWNWSQETKGNLHACKIVSCRASMMVTTCLDCIFILNSLLILSIFFNILKSCICLVFPEKVKNLNYHQIYPYHFPKNWVFLWMVIDWTISKYFCSPLQAYVKSSLFPHSPSPCLK